MHCRLLKDPVSQKNLQEHQDSKKQEGEDGEGVGKASNGIDVRGLLARTAINEKDAATTGSCLRAFSPRFMDQTCEEFGQKTDEFSKNPLCIEYKPAGSKCCPVTCRSRAKSDEEVAARAAANRAAAVKAAPDKEVAGTAGADFAAVIAMAKATAEIDDKMKADIAYIEADQRAGNHLTVPVCLHNKVAPNGGCSCVPTLVGRNTEICKEDFLCSRDRPESESLCVSKYDAIKTHPGPYSEAKKNTCDNRSLTALFHQTSTKVNSPN